MYDEGRLYDTIDVLVEIGEAYGVSAAQVALAWLLGRPAVTSVVVGARTDDQLADNLSAGSMPPHLLSEGWHHGWPVSVIASS